ncbi:MAG TPA: hypothetical protein VGG89_15810 [Candidatus Baltobacteraceae bacterium]|jgi:hypothetical protein
MKPFALTLALLTLAATGRALPLGESQESFITRAVVSESRLWLLSDGGALSSVALDTRRRSIETFAGRVLDICAANHTLFAISEAPGDDGVWVESHRRAQAWVEDVKVPKGGEKFIGFGCDESGTVLVTNRRLIVATGSSFSAVRLSKDLPIHSEVATVFATSKYVFVGINRGEWGGGLRRIDRSTGETSVIERNESGALCGGPLNTACDPVNAIAADPWAPDCIIVAVGLVHMAPHGRIDEVCGDNVRRLYFKVWENGGPQHPGEDEPFMTVAFYGLIVDGATVGALGIDGIYNIHRDGTATVTPLPKFEDDGGVYVGVALPNAIVVLTDANRRRAVGGSVPILAQR